MGAWYFRPERDLGRKAIETHRRGRTPSVRTSSSRPERDLGRKAIETPRAYRGTRQTSGSSPERDLGRKAIETSVYGLDSIPYRLVAVPKGTLAERLLRLEDLTVSPFRSLMVVPKGTLAERLLRPSPIPTTLRAHSRVPKGTLAERLLRRVSRVSVRGSRFSWSRKGPWPKGY